MTVKGGPANVSWHNKLLPVSVVIDLNIRAQSRKILVLGKTPWKFTLSNTLSCQKINPTNHKTNNPFPKKQTEKKKKPKQQSTIPKS